MTYSFTHLCIYTTRAARSALLRDRRSWVINRSSSDSDLNKERKKSSAGPCWWMRGQIDATVTLLCICICICICIYTARARAQLDQRCCVIDGLGSCPSIIERFKPEERKKQREREKKRDSAGPCRSADGCIAKSMMMMYSFIYLYICTARARN